MQNLCHPLHTQLPSLFSLSSNQSLHIKPQIKNPKFCFHCSSANLVEDGKLGVRREYKPNWLDDFFMSSFRKKLVEEVGWESEKEGYEGMMELVNGLMLGRTTLQTNQAAVSSNTQIPISSLSTGTLSNAYNTNWRGENCCYYGWVTKITCQWLMGPCSISTIELRDGYSCQSGVLVERCKYLEDSKCVGICVNTCKLPTQTFFKDHIGIPLLMEPNFNDYSCQFNFGVLLPPAESDSALKEPCLDSCPYVAQRGSKVRMSNAKRCPRS